MRAISYNLHEGRATAELAALAEVHDVDALCLQECDTLRLPEAVGPLVLAGATQRNRLGLALYYNPDRLRAHGHELRPLRRSMHDRFLSPAHERLLAVRFEDLQDDGALLTLASIHTAPLSATNAMRRHQITEALGAIRAAAHARRPWSSATSTTRGSRVPWPAGCPSRASRSRTATCPPTSAGGSAVTSTSRSPRACTSSG